MPSVRMLEATVLAFTFGKLSPDPPTAAAREDSKVSQVLFAEAPGVVAPVGTMPQLAVGGICIQYQQGLLVEQEEL